MLLLEAMIAVAGRGTSASLIESAAFQFARATRRPGSDQRRGTDLWRSSRYRVGGSLLKVLERVKRIRILAGRYSAGEPPAAAALVRPPAAASWQEVNYGRRERRPAYAGGRRGSAGLLRALVQSLALIDKRLGVSDEAIATALGSIEGLRSERRTGGRYPVLCVTGFGRWIRPFEKLAGKRRPSPHSEVRFSSLRFHS